MSKKKRKQPNTFLQSKNKKNMGSSKTKEYSPIKFDTFGRVSRFVNQVGSVPSTDTEMYGCEIVRDIPDYVNDFVKLVGLGEIIKVPKTNPNVLTGSGESRECHRNSTMLSISICGKNGRMGNRLCGYYVKEREPFSHNGIKIFTTILSPHSVWNTPEGKTRCVTDYGSRNKEILFIPVGLNSVEEEFCKELNPIKIYGVGKNDLGITDEVGIFHHPTRTNDKDGRVLEERIRMEDLVKLTRKERNNILYDKELIDMSFTNKDLYWENEILNSNFGKVSSTTGRSWDYFKNKILNTYYPTSLTLKTPKIVI